MKNLFLFLLSFFSLSIIAQVPLALVHIGDTIPSYTKEALIQARLFHEDITIYFVCDQKAAQNFKYNDIFEQYSINLVYTESLQITDIHSHIRGYYTAGLHFRDGYWLKTVERFYYLEELMNKYNLDKLFHIENDVLLYVDLNSYSKIFDEYYPSIASVLKDDEHCAPGIVYIGNRKRYSDYLRFLTQQGKIRPNELSLDMKVLINYMLKEGINGFNPLPVVPTDYIVNVGLRRQRGGTYSKYSQYYHTNFELFNSVFDAATLGIYFGGIDHRDRSHTSDCSDGYIYPGSMFNPSIFKYEWKIDEKNRKIPYLIYNDKYYRINNLHVHSKDLYRFVSY